MQLQPTSYTGSYVHRHSGLTWTYIHLSSHFKEELAYASGKRLRVISTTYNVIKKTIVVVLKS